VNRNELLTLAREHGPNACWMSDDADENCLLVTPAGVASLLACDSSAYEDPNPPGATPKHTRVVFPEL
jgi:hypothetical protein